MNVGKFSQQLILSSAMHMLGEKAGKLAYKIVGKDGAVLKKGQLDEEGKSERVFTEDMEELQAEVQVYDDWQFQEELRHDVDEDLDEVAEDIVDDVLVPVGVGVLAEQANMPVGMVRDMFKPDGTIDPMSVGMAVLRDKLNLPTMAILDVLRQRGDMKPLDALKAAAVDVAENYVLHHANDYINESAAKLVSLMGGHWRGGELPQDVRGVFDRARNAREELLAMARQKAQEAAYEVVVEASEELAVLSEGTPLELDEDEFEGMLPADLRGAAIDVESGSV